MFPILFAAKALSKMSSFGKSLDGKPVKNTTTEASAEKDAETAASATTNAVMQNVSNTTDTDKPEKEKEMFGGMDLGKIKSALDEDSPIGMPSEVKGGVYKQIFEVNKMMLGSLQRIESTMKLLLGLEYERAVGFQQQERDENLTEGDTDDKDGEKGPGRFKRGLSAAGDMLGGAYGGLKKFGSGSIAKLLGLGVLIFAFNKYREEIITAMAGILEYFNDVFEVFKSEGLGAAFNKVVDDFKTIFFPKIKQVSFDIMDFIWGAIKGAVVEWAFGKKGDARIREEATDVAIDTAGLEKAQKDLGLDSLDYTRRGLTTQSKDFKAANPDVTGKQRRDLVQRFNDTAEAMNEISQQSDGRVQWLGMPDFDVPDILSRVSGFTLQELLNAAKQPVVNGEIKDIEFLKSESFSLAKLSGVTKTMSDDTRDDIIDALKTKSILAASGASKAEIKAVPIEGQIFAPSGPNSVFTTNADFSATGDTSGKKLSYEELVQKRMNEITANRKYPTNVTSPIFDQKRINNVNASTTNNLGLSANPTSDVVRAFRIRALTEST